jgi:hypothetical protein
MRISLTVCLLLYCVLSKAQAETAPIQPAVGDVRDLSRLESEYHRLSGSVQKGSLHLLASLQQKEERLRRQLTSKDEAAAASLFAGSTAAYRQLEAQVNAVRSGLPLHPLKDYLPGVDSIQTAMRFLRGYQLPAGMPASLQNTQDKLLALQNQLQQANNIAAFIQQRQQQLQQQLQAFHLADKLMAYKKEAYYYKARVEQYKALLHDPDRLATWVLSLVRNLPAFQKFFLNNSYLSTLFRLPGSSTEATGQPIPGLQTRDQVDAGIAERLGPGANLATAVTTCDRSANPAAGGMQDARVQMNTWKGQLAGAGGNSNAAMADFRPNPQHNKSFFQRIQLGFDMQTQSSTNWVPALSTLGLSAGYRLNAHSIVGVGTAFKLGLGQPFNHIAFSSQGVSFRSFLDWKLKGNLWIAGGYEANYLNALEHFSQLRALAAWQSSALIGLMKTYKADRRTGNVQLFFDAFYRLHIPQSQPVLFRVGYSL